MTITVASGKGGTGKTLVATSLALSIGENAQFLDCDVEEPNGYIFLKPEIKKTIKICLPKPTIDIKRCSFCGRCRSACHYNAISVIKPGNKSRGKVLFFYELCHSCGACALVCPENAIYEKEEEKGTVEIGTARGIFSFIQGKLKVAEPSPVPVVKAVKKHIRQDRVNIIDACPGTSCPVVEAVKGADFCILVTEPTPFGLNDLALALGMTKKMGIPSGIIINRADIGDKEVENYAKKQGIPILLHIPFQRQIAVSYSRGIPLVSIFPEYVSTLKEIFTRIAHEILKNRKEYE